MVHEYLKGIFGDKERVLILATDHRYFGVISGLEEPQKVIPPLMPYVDALMTSQGALRSLSHEQLQDKPVILRASGCVSTQDIPVPGYLREPAIKAYMKRMQEKLGTHAVQNPLFSLADYEKRIETGQELTHGEWGDYNALRSIFFMPDTMARERLILHTDDVKAAGAQAAAVSIYIGTLHEDQTLDNLATMAREARKTGITVLGVVAVGKGLGYREQDADYLARAGAMAVEHGADMVKIYNCGPGFENVVKACGVPVVVAGGKAPKDKDPAMHALELTQDSLQKGAAGIDMGRLIWRNEHPVAMARAVSDVVHNGINPTDAYSKYKEYALGKAQK